MKVKMYAYERTTNLYMIDVDDKYAEDLSQCINDRLVNEADYVHLTEQDIHNILNGDDEQWTNDVLFKSYFSDGEPYKSTVAIYVNDYINDDLWDSYIDFVDGYTDDTEIEIED